MNTLEINWHTIRSNLTQLALTQNSAAVDAYLDETCQRLELSELQQQGMIIFFTEVLYTLSQREALDTLMLPKLGPAVQTLGEAAEYLMMLRGMTVSARIQLDRHEYSETRAILKAIKTVSNWAESTYYKHLPYILQFRYFLPEGNIKSAIAYLDDRLHKLRQEEAFEKQTELEDEILKELVLLCRANGNYQFLERYLTELTTLRAPNMNSMQAFHLGVVAEVAGDLDKASKAYNLAIDLSNLALDQRWSIESSVKLARLEPESAEAYLAGATKIADELNLLEAHELITYGGIQTRLYEGRYAEAYQAAKTVKNTDHPDLASICTDAFLAAQSEEANQAVKAFKDLANSCGYAKHKAYALTLEARIESDPSTQIELSQTAIEQFEALGDVIGKGFALVQYANARYQEGQSSAAKELIQQALSIGQKLREKYLLALCKNVQSAL